MRGRAQIGGIRRNFAKDNRKGGQTVSESLNYSDAGAVRRPDRHCQHSRDAFRPILWRYMLAAVEPLQRHSVVLRPTRAGFLTWNWQFPRR
jgi:hypothetical protein